VFGERAGGNTVGLNSIDRSRTALGEPNRFLQYESRALE
jgi:hypothetical protein